MCFHKKDIIDFDQNNRQIKQHLYKYYPLEDYNLKVFSNQEIFFTKPHACNDSFDVSEKLIDPYPEFRRRVGWNEQMRFGLGLHGIFSLTEAENVKNSRMWSLYANNYNGFAIEFNEAQFTAFDYWMVHAIPVLYRDAPLNLDDLSLQIKVRNEQFVLENIFSDIKLKDRFFECLHLIKDKSIWEEENEWRMIIGNLDNQTHKLLQLRNHPDGYYMPLKDGAYKSLFIGYRVPSIKQQTLK